LRSNGFSTSKVLPDPIVVFGEGSEDVVEDSNDLAWLHISVSPCGFSSTPTHSVNDFPELSLPRLPEDHQVNWRGF